MFDEKGIAVSEPPPHRNDRKKLCLVLNATVDVRGVVFVKRDDPIERLNDYRWALEQWTRCKGIDSLVFVENSGYNIDELRSIPLASSMHQDSFEFLSFDGQNFPRELGNGYGEDCLIVRINGRYFIENIALFFEALYPSTEILSDLQQSLTWADATVLGGTVNFFENYVCPYGRGVDDSKGYYFEHALARAVHRGLADGLVWNSYPEPPHIRGFSGTSNQNKAEGRLLRKRRDVQHKLKLRMLRR